MRSLIGLLFCVSLAAQTSKEAALGERMASEIRRATKPVESREVQDYVARLGARLASGFTFSVVQWIVQENSAEPVVLPGGSVFVPAGLLIASKDEADFALALARAMRRKPSRWVTGFDSLRPVNQTDNGEVHLDPSLLTAESAKEFERIRQQLLPKPRTPPSLFTK